MALNKLNLLPFGAQYYRALRLILTSGPQIWRTWQNMDLIL